jgi:hypothetical protein
VKSWRGSLLVVLAAVLVVVAVLAPRTGQDPAYHLLADDRTLFGVANALNVLSNLPFALVGLWGLRTVNRSPGIPPAARPAYLSFFTGVFLTAFGSAWYHLAPDNARLVWDRLPMTLAFAGLLAALLAERVDPRLGKLLLPLSLLGLASVFYWYATELRGAGDLRPYALMQFGPIALLPILLILYPGSRRATLWLVGAIALYVLAKVFEAKDAPIYALGLGVSGHTLKHLVAVGGILCIERSLPKVE